MLTYCLPPCILCDQMHVKNTFDRSDLVTSILVFQEESTKTAEHNKQMKVEKHILFLVLAKFFSLSFYCACFSKSFELLTWQMVGNAGGSTATSRLWHSWHKITSSNDHTSCPLSPLLFLPPHPTHTPTQALPGGFRAKWWPLEFWRREIL